MPRALTSRASAARAGAGFTTLAVMGEGPWAQADELWWYFRREHRGDLPTLVRESREGRAERWARASLTWEPYESGEMVRWRRIGGGVTDLVDLNPAQAEQLRQALGRLFFERREQLRETEGRRLPPDHLDYPADPRFRQKRQGWLRRKPTRSRYDVLPWMDLPEQRNWSWEHRHTMAALDAPGLPSTDPVDPRAGHPVTGPASGATTGQVPKRRTTAEVAGVFEWEGRLVATASVPSGFGYRVLDGVFGPLDDSATDGDLGEAILAALAHRADARTLRTDGEPDFVTALGASREMEVLATGRKVSVGRRASTIEVSAQGSDGRGWSATTSMPSITLQDGDAAALGAAAREMLDAFTRLGPEEPSHT